MGRLLDLIDGRRQSGDLETGMLDISDISDKSPPFGRLNRLCRTSSSLMTALAERPDCIVEPQIETVKPATPVEAWRAGVARLNPAHNLAHPTMQSWAMFIRDCQRFLDSEWASKAAALGWNERALFGVLTARPDAVSCWGVVHRFHGAQITAISGGLMRLMPRGVLHRCEHGDIVVPVWMLLKR